MWLYLLITLFTAPAPAAPDLARPVRIQAGGQPINVDGGHAAPFLGELNGDGQLVLLVGQFQEGKLRLYPNIGPRNNPQFDRFEWFQAGGRIATVPFG